MTEQSSTDPFDDFRADVLKAIQPVRFKILIALAEVKDTTSGGVIIPDETKDREHVAERCGVVLGIGADAFKDERRFPSGATCKVGDWVVFRSYEGNRLHLSDMEHQEFRLINDDQVEAITTEPQRIARK